MSDYPECEKVKAVSDNSSLLGEFLDWANEQGYQLYEWVEDPNRGNDWNGKQIRALVRVRGGSQELIARFYDIDLKKVEEERQQMLKDLRDAQNHAGGSEGSADG